MYSLQWSWGPEDVSLLESVLISEGVIYNVSVW